MAADTALIDVDHACTLLERVYATSNNEKKGVIEQRVSNLSFLHISSAGASNRSRYEQDFYAWTQETAALIRAGQWYDLNLEILAEEVDDLGASQYNAVSSDLYQVLIHLLKWQYQPALHVDSHSWRDSIVEHRDRIERLCTRSPSLRTHLSAMLAAEYPRARRRASIQTDLPLTTFPVACPWTLEEEVLHADFWPEEAPPSTEGAPSDVP